MNTASKVVGGKSLMHERIHSSPDGYLMVAVGLFLIVAGGYWAWSGFNALEPVVLPIFGKLLISILGAFLLSGLYMLQPNEAALLSLFGKYIGTDRSAGLRWANPLYSVRKVSLRARTLNSPTLKVNDKRGNPVEIGAAIVWRVQDTALALFNIDDFERFVNVQAETAIRHLASQYAYDEGDDLAEHETTLRAGLDEVTKALRQELHTRFEVAGIDVEDAKLTHLAYAPEIAQVMLRRQQADAIISARKKIVHGAVTMVEEALKGLSERKIVELDDERKAAMVSNLLVVLCSDKETQPIINTGTLYN
ncbi:SPFH domain-containing protein [Undibacterium sp. RTI2.1]|uniref:SPFH domain-containing protein n=1 Tax=unclassified Undibacterium TaxID=2630295 RepID=UPI002AB427F1|nr:MULTISPECIES: SPFH domain-containing protein [unclassified Undibacterium]MDY7540113.1 SPFH domain-containing protein [Undibacterium sp. 5I1]MEB0031696.1 SPFH domain-containing protein [Undibacterium sp. RTI2.1]MEB0118052.1 SPFH domain-containing protein [Undibacterium sp. RTI2.2]MEB0233135.1 SPFH domain-containing protein [Undibacterium sp. 10I3]MEB0259215.1 SPFH domain-containing protein [Undibacterium sp. 5I1]